jgi:CRP-like cAMP-binding protein
MPEKSPALLAEAALRHIPLTRESNISPFHPSLFTGISPESMEILLSNSHLRNIGSGELILQQGDTPSFLYVVTQGHIRTVRSKSDGEEVAIRLLVPGDTFMDAVIFMGGPSPVSACAMDASQVLLIPAETVRYLALRDPVFACNLLKIVTLHYKNALQQIDGIATRTPAERLGYYLLKQHLEQGSESMDFKLPFQKSVIANHLGMTPETFSRALHQIKTLGIDVNQNTITLRNAFLLCHFCDQDTVALCPKAGTKNCPSRCPGRSKTEK